MMVDQPLFAFLKILLVPKIESAARHLQFLQILLCAIGRNVPPSE
jgi:hypothetical protein